VKAVVYKEPYKVAVEEVDDPKIQNPTDAIVQITTSAICGSDLHMYEGRTGADPGIVFGHENMGIVQEVGPGVGKLKPAWNGSAAHRRLPGAKTLTAGKRSALLLRHT